MKTSITHEMLLEAYKSSKCKVCLKTPSNCECYGDCEKAGLEHNFVWCGLGEEICTECELVIGPDGDGKDD